MNRKKVIYAILKELLKGNIQLKAEDFDITWKQYQDIALLMYTEGFLDKKPLFMTQSVSFKFTQVTLKGEDFLEENSAWKKTYKGLKEVKTWLPLG